MAIFQTGITVASGHGVDDDGLWASVCQGEYFVVSIDLISIQINFQLDGLTTVEVGCI